MNKQILWLCLFLILPVSVMANEDFIAEQRNDFDTLSADDIVKLRQDILSMSQETLKQLYKEHPQAKKEIENA